MPETVRKRVLVSGRVQGVFYRDTARRRAEQLGVAGRASNLSDGRVEVIVEGPASSVEQMVEWCREGSSYSEVTSVEVTSEEPEGLEGFETR